MKVEVEQKISTRRQKRIFRERKFLDDFPVNQMLLNDAFQNFRRATVIPHAFRINDGDRPARADTQAIDLGAIDQRRRPGQAQFLEPVFQKFPRGDGLFARTTFRLGRIGAQKDVPAKFIQPQSFNRILQFIHVQR